MTAFQEPHLPQGYGPGPSGYRFVPYRHVAPPKGSLVPLEAYEPTRNACSPLCGLFPCMCRDNRRGAAQSYNDPLVPQISPFSSSPQVKRKRRSSAPSSFLQRILRIGSKSESTHPAMPTRTPPYNAYVSPVHPPRRTTRASAPVLPGHDESRRRRKSTSGYTRPSPQPVANISRLPTQTPVVQHQPLPDIDYNPPSWIPPSRADMHAYTPQVASAALPETTHSSRTRRELASSGPRRERSSARIDTSSSTSNYAMPSRHRSRPHRASLATSYSYGPALKDRPGVPPTPYVPQISSDYTSPAQPPPLEEPLYFSNHTYHPLRWLAPECRLPRPFILKGRHFWSVAQAVSWWKALAAGDIALARVIKNLDPGLPKKEFERREARLSNAICTPSGWVQGLTGVYKTVVLAAFSSDDAGMRTLLLDTGFRELVWDASDWDWGRGGNRYGQILMDARSQLRQEVHNAAHRKIESRMPPTATPRASSRHHHTSRTAYPYTGYSDLHQRPSRSGRHHVQFNPTPMVQII